MIDSPPVAVDTDKHRCPTDRSTQFYYTEQGLSYRCRHCKNVQIVSWKEVLQKYQEIHKASITLSSML